MFLTGRTPEPHTAFWAWLRISFAIAFIIAWLQEYRKAKNTELRLNAAINDSKPSFSFTLGQIFVGLQDGVTIAIIQGRIINQGAASAVINWNARYRSTTLDSEVPIIHPVTPLTFNMPTHIYVFDGATALYQKALAVIPRGGFIEGRIAVKIPGHRSEEATSGTATLTITIKDYLEQPYSASFKGGGPRDSTPDYAPGDNVTPRTLN